MRHRPRGVIIWVQMFTNINANPHRRPKMQNTDFAKQNPAHGAGRNAASTAASFEQHDADKPKRKTLIFAKQNPVNGASRNAASIRAAGLFRTGHDQTQNTNFCKTKSSPRSRPELRLDSGRRPLSNRTGPNAKHSFCKTKSGHRAGRNSASTRAAGTQCTERAQTQNTVFAKQTHVGQDRPHRYICPGRRPPLPLPTLTNDCYTEARRPFGQLGIALFPAMNES